MMRTIVVLVCVCVLMGCKNQPETAHPETDEPESICDVYEKCCWAYLASLKKIEGASPEAFVNVEKGCREAGTLKTEPDSEGKCRAGLEAIQEGISGSESAPGFEVPGECSESISE
jgi:hypothetical protein